jgi:hypothetical protein
VVKREVQGKICVELFHGSKSIQTEKLGREVNHAPTGSASETME